MEGLNREDIHKRIEHVDNSLDSIEDEIRGVKLDVDFIPTLVGGGRSSEFGDKRAELRGNISDALESIRKAACNAEELRRI